MTSSSSRIEDAKNPWTDNTPKILLCGLPRSGKTSVHNVVFHKMSPHETLFLDSTTKLDIRPVSSNRLIQFKLCDFPGSYAFPEEQDQLYFTKCSALVFIVDAQDEPYTEALAVAKKLILRAWRVNPKVMFEVFIHKVDGDLFLSDEHKTDCQREIHSKLTEELFEMKVDAQITFHCTSIYDHSIFEAFSKVVQKLIPQLSVLEQLLDNLIANSKIDKAFLFDVVSKVYIASDSQAVDMQSYELCSDVIDVVIDVSCIYGLSEDPEAMAYDPRSQCIIQLNNGTLLYLREVDRYLALVFLMREENFDRQYLVDYNITVFKEALMELFTGPAAVADASRS